MQQIQSDFAKEWYTGNSKASGSTAVFGKFANRLQIDTKLNVKSGALTLTDYTSRNASDRHLRTDAGLTAETYSPNDAYQFMKVLHVNDEDIWGWNEVTKFYSFLWKI